MLELYKNESNISLNKYKYIWILDCHTNQRYMNINSYYRIFTNYSLFVKNNMYLIKYIFGDRKYKLKFIKTKIFEKIFSLNNISLKLIGLGYKIIYITNQILLLYVGYSYNLYIYLPSSISYTINKEGTFITLVSKNRILLMTIVYKLKQLKKPNPYKENGFKFIHEIFIPKSYKK